MSVIGNAPPPPPSSIGSPAETPIKPSGWWYLAGHPADRRGLVGGVGVIVGGFVNLSRLVDDFMRI